MSNRKRCTHTSSAYNVVLTKYKASNVDPFFYEKKKKRGRVRTEICRCSCWNIAYQPRHEEKENHKLIRLYLTTVKKYYI